MVLFHYHLNGFSPLWLPLCIANLEEKLNYFLHKSHCSLFSSVFIFLIGGKFRSLVKRQPVNSANC